MKQARWTEARRAAAFAGRQAVRDANAADLDAWHADARKTLRLTVADDCDGAPLVDWRLIPDRRNVRQYRVLDCATLQPVVVDGAALRAGKDRVMQAAAAMMPCYGGRG